MSDIETSEDLQGLHVPRIALTKYPANFGGIPQVRSDGDDMAEKTTIEVDASLVPMFETIANDFEARVESVRAAEVVRGEEADAAAGAIAAALQILEPLKAEINRDAFIWLGDLVGHSIKELTWIERADASIARCDELEAEAARADEEKAAAERAENPFMLNDDGTLNEEGYPEEQRSVMRSQFDLYQGVIARNADLEAELAENKAEATRAADEKLVEEVTRACGQFDDLPGDKDKRLDLMLRAKRADSDLYDAMTELWEQAMAGARALAQGEVGSSAGANGNDASTSEGLYAQIRSATDTKVKEAADAGRQMDYATARSAVLRENPGMYDRYLEANLAEKAASK